MILTLCLTVDLQCLSSDLPLPDTYTNVAWPCLHAVHVQRECGYIRFQVDRGHRDISLGCSEKHLTLTRQKPHRSQTGRDTTGSPPNTYASGLQLLAFTCCWILTKAAAQLSRQAPTRRGRFWGPTPPLQQPNPAHGIVQFAAQHFDEQLLAGPVYTHPTHSCSCDSVKQAARLSQPLIIRVSKGYNSAQHSATNTPALLQPGTTTAATLQQQTNSSTARPRQ